MRLFCRKFVIISVLMMLSVSFSQTSVEQRLDRIEAKLDTILMLLRAQKTTIIHETIKDNQHLLYGIGSIKDFRFHDLRHTFASRLVMAGVDIRTVQELMCHKDIKMTMRYSHLSDSHLREAVVRLVHGTNTSQASGDPGNTPEKS